MEELLKTGARRGKQVSENVSFSASVKLSKTIRSMACKMDQCVKMLDKNAR